MKYSDIIIGDKEYTVIIAETDELKKKGLRKRESLADNKGMLFIWDSPQEVSMTMDETYIPLDLIFINKDNKVIQVSPRIDTEQDLLVSCEDTLMVLEVNLNSGIEVGDEFEFIDDDSKYVMKVLAPDGSTQMYLEGGERIVSRKQTLVLIKKAKSAWRHRKEPVYDNLCKSLGKYMFKVLNGQDNRDPEYVKLPD